VLEAKKKAAFAANLREIGDFCVDHNTYNTAVAIDWDYWVLGIQGFEKSLTGIDNKLFECSFIVTVKFRYN
jgi:hypothetical protein